MPQVNALFDVWETQPPAAQSLARIAMAIGAWKPKAKPRPREAAPQRTREEVLAELAPLLGRGFRFEGG